MLAEPEKPCNMEELYKDAPNLPMDVTNSPSAMANNKLENGVAQLITAEAWNINSADLMKKALSPLVTVPAPSILTPPAESQSGVALKVAATVLQPICLGDSPVVLPIHLQVAGSAAPQMPAANTTTPYVMTTQGPVPLPVLLEQHVFQHLNSPLVLPPGAACPASPLHTGLFPGAAPPVGQPQLLDPKPSGQPQEPVLPPVFQTPGFAAVLQDLFPSQGALGSAPCQPPPDYTTLPPQAFSSPLSPLVPPATLLVPYPVIVPLPVPVPIPIPVPIPVPHSAEAKAAPDPPKPQLFTAHSCKGTQTPLEKEETKPFDLPHPREFPQLSRHTVIKMGGDNEALDLSMKGPPVPRASEAAPPPEDGALDLSLASCRKPVGPLGEVAGTVLAAAAEASGHPVLDKLPGPAAPFAPCKPQEAGGKAEGRGAGGGQAELLRQQHRDRQHLADSQSHRLRQGRRAHHLLRQDQGPVGGLHQKLFLQKGPAPGLGAAVLRREEPARAPGHRRGPQETGQKQERKAKENELAGDTYSSNQEATARCLFSKKVNYGFLEF